MKTLSKTAVESTTKKQELMENGLPMFDQVIQVEVPVADIYKKMLETFPEDYKHREMLAHAIVGSAEERGGLSTIYNALNGYRPEINFALEDQVICNEKERYEWYDSNKERENGEEIDTGGIELGEPNWKRRSVPIGNCKVIRINLYGDRKLIVEYKTAKWNCPGEYEWETSQVYHTGCTKIGGTLPVEG